MNREVDVLFKDFEEFKKNSKEVEEFLENEVRELEQKLLDKELRIKELKQEVKEFKNRFSNQSGLIMKLHQEIDFRKKALEDGDKVRRRLEIENDAMEVKLRNFEYKVGELEQEIEALREKIILSQFDFDEEVRKKDKVIEDLNEKMKISGICKINSSLKVSGLYNRRSLSGQCRDMFNPGRDISKYFHEFDEVIQSSFCDFFRCEMKKIQEDSLYVFFGFRSIIRVLQRFFQSKENDWTAIKLSRSGRTYSSFNLTQAEINELFNLGERKKTDHYIHSIRFKSFNIQIFDLCENDSESIEIFQDIYQGITNNEGFADILNHLYCQGKVLVNLNCFEQDKIINFVETVNGIVHIEKGTQTSGCCCKDTAENMIHLIGKYKKELECLKKKLKNADIQLVNANETIKDKERESKVELARLRSNIGFLKSVVNQHKIDSKDNSLIETETCDKYMSENYSRVGSRRLGNFSLSEIENRNPVH